MAKGRAAVVMVRAGGVVVGMAAVRAAVAAVMVMRKGTNTVRVAAPAPHGHDDGNVAVVARPLGETFKIAVTSQNRKTVTEHAGKCRKFWVYEIKAGAVVGKQLLELLKDQSLHETAPGEAHPLDEVSVLLTTGFGAGLQQRLARKGIEAMMTEEKTPDAAVEAFLKQLA